MIHLITYYRLTTLVAAVLTIMATTLSPAASPPIVTPEQEKAWAISTPKPQYPETARLRRAMGSGFLKLRVQIKTGKVKEVTVLRTTGDRELDTAAIRAFRQWRFKPDVLPSIRSNNPKTKDPFANEDCLLMVPVTFVLTRSGASGQSTSPSPTSTPGKGIFAPKPKYPREWQEKGLTGKGVISLTVDPKTGYVTEARMLKSTGHKVLDDSALEAFRKWHFKPGVTPTEIKVPIEFEIPFRQEPQT